MNHSIYWKNLSPTNKDGGKLPSENSELAQQVKKQFGSFEKLIETLSTKTIAIKGSGWGWLAYDKAANALKILELPNQETLVPDNLTPLLSKLFLMQQLMFGSMLIMWTTRMLEQTMLKIFGRSLTGKRWKEDLMRRRVNDPLVNCSIK